MDLVGVSVPQNLAAEHGANGIGPGEYVIKRKRQVVISRSYTRERAAYVADEPSYERDRLEGHHRCGW